VALPPENLLFLMRGKVSPAGKRVTGTFPIAAGCVKTEESPSTQQSCLPTHQRKCRSGKRVYFSGARASEPLDCIYHFIQTKESVIEAIILPLCILLLNCLRLYAPNLWLGNKNVTFSHNHTQRVTDFLLL
jgi:hypothetical protein